MPRRTPRSCERCLSGEAGPPRDVVLLNAGAALFIAGEADTVKAGIAQAAAAIDSGAAEGVLDAAGRRVESQEAHGVSATPDLLEAIVAATARASTRRSTREPRAALERARHGAARRTRRGVRRARCRAPDRST